MASLSYATRFMPDLCLTTNSQDTTSKPCYLALILMCHRALSNRFNPCDGPFAKEVGYSFELMLNPCSTTLSWDDISEDGSLTSSLMDYQSLSTLTTLSEEPFVTDNGSESISTLFKLLCMPTGKAIIWCFNAVFCEPACTLVHGIEGLMVPWSQF